MCGPVVRRDIAVCLQMQKAKAATVRRADGGALLMAFLFFFFFLNILGGCTECVNMCSGCWSLDSQQMSKGKRIANTHRPKFKGLWYVPLQITAERFVFTSDHMHVAFSEMCAVGGTIDTSRTHSGKRESARHTTASEEDDRRNHACNSANLLNLLRGRGKYLQL